MTGARRTLSLSRSLLPGVSPSDCVLAVVDGPDRGLKVSFHSGHVSVGADPDCDLVLERDDAVSGFHVELALLDNGVSVRDLDSTNGTFYLGARIGEAMLQIGSLFRVGTSVLAVLPPDDRAGPPDVAPDAGDAAGLVEESLGGLRAHSLARRRLYRTLGRVAASDAPFSLIGEPGSGKRVLARAVHELSRRGAGPFVVVDCQADGDTVQRALFGARGADPGALVHADGGTLLLRAVDELPLALHARLLRALETGQHVVAGEQSAREIDVRPVATACRPLAACVAAGTMHADLSYRLTVVEVAVPALRDCPEDVMPLARGFLSDAGATDAASLFTPTAAAALQSYHWPGNVRQLESAMQGAATLGGLDLDRQLARAVVASDSDDDAALDFHEAKARMVDRFERAYLVSLMQRNAGNMSASARESGVVRHHLRRLLKKHAIDPNSYRPSARHGEP